MTGRRWMIGLLQYATAVMALFYVLQVCSPLRLNTDAVDLVQMGLSGAETGNYYPEAESVRYPPGYPFLISVLMVIGAFTPATVVVLNLLFLGVGMWVFFSATLGEGRHGQEFIWLAVFGTMLSWVLIKHVTLPLTDIPFMGAALLAVGFMIRAQSGASSMVWIFSGMAFLACVAGIAIRSAGIALLPPMGWTIYILISREWACRRLLDRVLSALLLASFLAVGILLASGHWSFRPAGHGFTPSAIPENLWQQAESLGRVALNLPYAQPWMDAFSGACGAALIVLFALKLFPRTGRPGAAEIYVASYVALMLLWPFNDPRFFLPVLPFVFMAVSEALFARWHGRVWRIVFLAFGVWFVSSGTAAMAYSSWLSLSGPEFSNRFGSEAIRGPYRQFYRGDWSSAGEADKEVIALLQRFDSRRIGSLSGGTSSEKRCLHSEQGPAKSPLAE